MPLVALLSLWHSDVSEEKPADSPPVLDESDTPAVRLAKLLSLH